MSNTQMDTFQDYYAVLGVAPTADSEVIRAAYRVLAQRYHPDRNANTDGSEMARLNQAYSVLSCPQRRAEFDRMQRRMNMHAQARFYTANSQPNASAPMRRPLVFTTYDHRGRLHAYA